MKHLLHNLVVSLNDKIYQKDPASSELGQRILMESVIMIDELGLEAFTFKKLATKLSTTESSIYRYFENKHKLLIYHVSFYWSWLEYHLVFSTSNLGDAHTKLEKALDLLVSPIEGFEEVNQVNMSALHRIIINESSKAFFSKEVDDDNKEGFFTAYKSFCARLSLIIEEINPHYPYPHSLISTAVEGIQLQKFYANHLPSLSDFHKKESNIKQMFFELICRTISK